MTVVGMIDLMMHQLGLLSRVVYMCVVVNVGARYKRWQDVWVRQVCMTSFYLNNINKPPVPGFISFSVQHHKNHHKNQHIIVLVQIGNIDTATLVCIVHHGA